MPKNMEVLSRELKKAENAYKYRKILIQAKPLVEKVVRLPRPGPAGKPTLDNKDPYDDYDELKKTMTRESFVLNGKLFDDFVGECDKSQVFKLWYQHVRDALTKMSAHDSLLDIMHVVSPETKPKRRLSCLPIQNKTSINEDYSSHVLIMWIMQASSRSRAGSLAYKCLQRVFGVPEGDTKTMIFDTMQHPSATRIRIKENILRVEIRSVLTIQRDEGDIDFEFDVGCTTIQILDLKTFLYERKIEFGFFEFAKDVDKLSKKRKKKLETKLECSMDPISFQKNTNELEILASVYHPQSGSPLKGNNENSTKVSS